MPKLQVRCMRVPNTTSRSDFYERYGIMKLRQRDGIVITLEPLGEHTAPVQCVDLDAMMIMAAICKQPI